MLRSLVVPLDGSGFAETAIPVARALARAAGASIRLVMAHQPSPVLVGASAPDDREVQAQERTYLAAQAADLRQLASGPGSQVLLEGHPGPALVEWLTAEQPDLVVMATHGRGPASRFWLGSVADYLVRHARAPLLLLRPPAAEGPQAAPTFRAGLVALDLSNRAEAVLETVAPLALATQAHLTLLYVLEPGLGMAGTPAPYPVSLPHDLLEHTREEAQRYLDGVADRLRTRGLQVATKVLVGFGVAGALLAQLGRDEYDFVAASTHGAGGFRRMLIGSVADKLVRGATKPVLLVRSDRHLP